MADIDYTLSFGNHCKKQKAWQTGNRNYVTILVHWIVLEDVCARWQFVRSELSALFGTFFFFFWTRHFNEFLWVKFLLKLQRTETVTPPERPHERPLQTSVFQSYELQLTAGVLNYLILHFAINVMWKYCLHLNHKLFSDCKRNSCSWREGSGRNLMEFLSRSLIQFLTASFWINCPTEITLHRVMNWFNSRVPSHSEWGYIWLATVHKWFTGAQF